MSFTFGVNYIITYTLLIYNCPRKYTRKHPTDGLNVEVEESVGSTEGSYTILPETGTRSCPGSVLTRMGYSTREDF